MGFKGIKVTKTYSQINHAKPAKVFPLLCPVKEKNWIDGWEYKMIYSESGVVEKGCIFSTPHHGNEETIWYVTEHDVKNFKVEFLRVTPKQEVVKIKIILEENGDDTTTSNITYEYTGLSKERNHWIKNELDKSFNDSMAWWKNAINHYLKTGKKLMK